MTCVPSSTLPPCRSRVSTHFTGGKTRSRCSPIPPSQAWQSSDPKSGFPEAWAPLFSPPSRQPGQARPHCHPSSAPAVEVCTSFPTAPHLTRGSPPAPLATPHGLQGHSRERGQRVTIALNCLNPGVTHVTSTHSPLARASPVTQPDCKGGWEMWTSSWTMRGCARAGAHHIQRQCAPQMPGLVRDNTLSCYITHFGFLF